MNSKFFKFIAATLFLGIILVVGLNLSAVTEPPKRQNISRTTIDLASGKKLIIPSFPGLVRVDGLYPEIDDLFIPEQWRNKVAMFYPTEKVWVESNKLILQGQEPEEYFDNTWVSSAYMSNNQHLDDKIIQKLVVGWRHNGPENRVTFSDAPDSEFWYSDGTDTTFSITKHLNIYGYTILNNQIITMTFLRIPEELPVTKEWITVQEKKVEDWVREIRKTNNY